MPDQAENARGFTFIGTVTRRFPGTGEEFGVTFNVERTFANHPDRNATEIDFREGAALTLGSLSCMRYPGINVDERYLFSIAFLSNPQGFNTAAWQLDGDNATLVRMFPGPVDPRLASATTVR